MLTSAQKVARLFVDDRWTGTFGIGTYSSSVLQRLRLPSQMAGYRVGSLSAGGILQASAARQRPADVVYSPGFMPVLTRARQVLTVHDLIHLSGEQRTIAAYYEVLVKPTIKHAKVVFTVSDYSAEKLRIWLDDSRVSIVIARNGVGPLWPPAPLPVPVPFFLCVSNMKPHKNVRTLLAAVKRTPDARLVLVLPRSDVQQALSLIDSLRLTRVHVLSNLSSQELAWLYTTSLATVLPSTEEGFGLPAAESIAYGTPVICAADCAALVEVVGADGVFVDAALSEYAWTSALSNAMGGRLPLNVDGSRFIGQWDASARIVDETLSSLLNA